jgi:hypothetical protein
VNVIYIIYLTTLCKKIVEKWGEGNIIPTEGKNYAVDKV